MSVLDRIFGLVRYVVTSRVSSDGLSDGAKGPPVPQGGTTQAQQPRQELFARFYPWGFDSRMPINGTGVTVAPSGGTNQMLVGARHPNYTPPFTDETWTTILHNEVGGTWVKLRADGGVVIEGKGSKIEQSADGTVRIDSKAGQNIILNGGSLDNARKDDGVWAGVLKIVNSTDGMTQDKTEWYFTTKDPQDPNYPFGERKIFEWTGPLGSAVSPNPGAEPDGFTVNLTGVITRGRTNVKS